MRLEALGFRGQLVILSGEQVVQIAYRLEEDVQARLSLYGPEDAAVLEPGVREDAVKPPEDVDEVLQTHILALRVVQYGEAAGEELLVRNNVGGPIERVTAVVDGAAGLGLLVYGAEELPFGGAHFGAGARAAGGCVEEEADNEGVALRDEKAAELVKPYRPFDAGRWLSQQEGALAAEGLSSFPDVVVVQGCEVLLELECRVEL